MNDELGLTIMGGGVTCECGHYFKLWYLDAMPDTLREVIVSTMDDNKDIVLLESSEAATNLVTCPVCKDTFQVPPNAAEFGEWYKKESSAND